MPWVKLDDNFPHNEKVMLAGRDGRALYITALCHCANQLTDGFIRTQLVPILGALAEIDDPKASASRLVEVGLWEAADGGYIVHDYHDYNPNREKVLAMRHARAEAGSVGGQRSGEARREQDEEEDQANAKQNGSKMPSKIEAQSNPVPVPVPVPVPNPVPRPHDSESSEGPPSGDAGASRASPTKPKKPPKAPKAPIPPAIQVYHANTGRYPAKSLWPDVEAAVGDDLEFWAKVVKGWLGMGWSKVNVNGMLEFFERREVPGGKRKGMSGRGETSRERRRDSAGQYGEFVQH